MGIHVRQAPGKFVRQPVFSSRKCPSCEDGCSACEGTGIVSGVEDHEVFEVDPDARAEIAPHATRLRTLRRAYHLRLHDLATLLGLTVAQLSGLERGLIVPVDGWDAFWRIADAQVAQHIVNPQRVAAQRAPGKSRPPRYDAVYFEGVAAMDAGESVAETRTALLNALGPDGPALLQRAATSLEAAIRVAQWRNQMPTLSEAAIAAVVDAVGKAGATDAQLAFLDRALYTSGLAEHLSVTFLDGDLTLAWSTSTGYGAQPPARGHSTHVSIQIGPLMRCLEVIADADGSWRWEACESQIICDTWLGQEDATTDVFNWVHEFAEWLRGGEFPTVHVTGVSAGEGPTRE